MKEKIIENKKVVVVATGNVHKLKEIQQIFPEYTFISQKEAGFLQEVEETGKTFEENAIIKAKAAAEALQIPVIADDSGICVDALLGEPGIYSARYSGEHGNEELNRKLLLKNMSDKQNRSAYFKSVMVLYYPNGKYYLADGKTYGKILFAEEGTGGFGYDSLFYSDDLKKSFGVASAEEKNSVSHRFRALIALKKQTGGVL